MIALPGAAKPQAQLGPGVARIEKTTSAWNQALPLGCGRLGAMVFGYVLDDRLQLNEDSLWSGGPRDRSNPRYASLPTGDPAHVARTVNSPRRTTWPTTHSRACRTSCGTTSRWPMRCSGLSIPGKMAQRRRASLDTASGLLPPDMNPENVSAYRRELSLSKAVATVSYTLRGVNYERRYLASAGENVIAGAVHGQPAGRDQLSGPAGTRTAE